MMAEKGKVAILVKGAMPVVSSHLLYTYVLACASAPQVREKNFQVEFPILIFF